MHNERRRDAMTGAAGIALGTTIKYLRRATSGAAGNGLGTTIKYLRGAACIGQGPTIKYLRRVTSGAAGKGLSHYRGLLVCPFATSAPCSPLFCARLLRLRTEMVLPRTGA
jgi:hypothetical protein